MPEAEQDETWGLKPGWICATRLLQSHAGKRKKGDWCKYEKSMRPPCMAVSSLEREAVKRKVGLGSHQGSLIIGTLLGQGTWGGRPSKRHDMTLSGRFGPLSSGPFLGLRHAEGERKLGERERERRNKGDDENTQHNTTQTPERKTINTAKRGLPVIVAMFS